MNDPRELFLHELGDILYAERTLVKALPEDDARSIRARRSAHAFGTPTQT